MTENDGGGKCPQDLVALFHASFHPTKGNIVDWSLKASDDLNLDQLEFSALPSGLHLVEKDVVYFTKGTHHGVCIFRRRQTSEQGHRGVRLSSLGILLAKSKRPRPWRHVKALKALINEVYSKASDRISDVDAGREGVNQGSLDVLEQDWDVARKWFEDRKVSRADLGGAGDWTGWSDELDGPYSDPPSSNPTSHLPHLLRVLGPSSLTLYKHVLGRKRILIFTLPPVEVACILCQVAGDLCFDTQAESDAENGDMNGRLKGKHREPINVLGMVTLADLDRLEAESRTGRGWIACTTDAIFMEKPSYYDLFIDLTTSTPNKATRPTFYSSKPVPATQPGPSRPPQYRLSTIRFAWSDVKLWTEINRILQLDSETAHQHHQSCCPPSSSSPPSSPSSSDNPTKPWKSITAWTDAWQVYEDVCIICAGLWTGSWRGNSTMSYSTGGGSKGPNSLGGSAMENWGSVRLEGDDDLSLGGMGLGSIRASSSISSGADGKVGQGIKPQPGAQLAYVRNLGMGIEGRPAALVEGSSSTLGHGSPSPKAVRRASAMSWSSGRATIVGSGSTNGKARQASSASAYGETYPNLNEDDERTAEEDQTQRRAGQVMTTMAVLQTFHAHTAFQLSVLEDLLVEQGVKAGFNSGFGPVSSTHSSNPGGKILSLTPKDILAFELGPLSGFDARYLEWLAGEYAGEGVKVVLRRGWKDLLGAIFGY